MTVPDALGYKSTSRREAGVLEGWFGKLGQFLHKDMQGAAMQTRHLYTGQNPGRGRIRGGIRLKPFGTVKVSVFTNPEMRMNIFCSFRFYRQYNIHFHTYYRQGVSIKRRETALRSEHTHVNIHMHKNTG